MLPGTHADHESLCFCLRLSAFASFCLQRRFHLQVDTPVRQRHVLRACWTCLHITSYCGFPTSLQPDLYRRTMPLVSESQLHASSWCHGMLTFCNMLRRLSTAFGGFGGSAVLSRSKALSCSRPASISRLMHMSSAQQALPALLICTQHCRFYTIFFATREVSESA